MNVLNDEQIRELTKHRSPLSVSIFLPTHRTGRERRQDAIRLKNMVNEARDRMRGQVGSASAIDAVLQPAAELRSHEEYWRHRSDGLACFCAPGVFRPYRVPVKLTQYISVNERFYIRPLLPLLRRFSFLYLDTYSRGSEVVRGDEIFDSRNRASAATASGGGRYRTTTPIPRASSGGTWKRGLGYGHLPRAQRSSRPSKEGRYEVLSVRGSRCDRRSPGATIATGSRLCRVFGVTLSIGEQLRPSAQ